MCRHRTARRSSAISRWVCSKYVIPFLHIIDYTRFLSLLCLCSLLSSLCCGETESHFSRASAEQDPELETRCWRWRPAAAAAAGVRSPPLCKYFAQAHWRLQTLALKIIILGQVTLVQKLRPRGHGFNQNNAFVLD